MRSKGYVCRAPANKCDPEEVCDGNAAACPANLVKNHGYTFK